MPTTTLKFSKIGVEDLEIGTGTFEVELSDGRRATLNRINLSSFASSDTVANAVYFTNGSFLGQDEDFAYSESAKQLTLGDSNSSIRIGSTGTAQEMLHIAGVGTTRVRIDNSDAAAGDAALELALHGTVDWNITADDSDSDNLKISAGSAVSSTPHITLFRNSQQVSIGGGSASTYITNGIKINNGAANDHVFEAESDTFTHGVTDSADAHTYMWLQTATTANGGAGFGGISSAQIALVLSGTCTNEDTGTSDSANGIIEIRSGTKSGTSFTAPSATANLVAIYSAQSAAVVLFKGDGDVHNSGGSSSMGTYDDYDDAKLLQAVKGTMDPSYKQRLGHWIDEHTGVLERGGVIMRDSNSGNYWISQRGWRGLLIDAIAQMASRIEGLESRLAIAERKSFQLKG